MTCLFKPLPYLREPKIKVLNYNFLSDLSVYSFMSDNLRGWCHLTFTKKEKLHISHDDQTYVYETYYNFGKWSCFGQKIRLEESGCSCDGKQWTIWFADTGSCLRSKFHVGLGWINLYEKKKYYKDEK